MAADPAVTAARHAAWRRFWRRMLAAEQGDERRATTAKEVPMA